MRAALAVLGKFALAYVLLSMFWASAPMSRTAFSWAFGPGAGAIAGAPDLLELAGLGTMVGALWRIGPWLSGSPDYWRDHVIVSVVGGIIVPVLLTRLIGPREAEQMGIRRPGRPALQLAALAYLSLLPLALAMALHAEFRRGAAEALGLSPWFALAIPVSSVAEHFFFHGVLLAWLHPSGVFPPAHELVGPVVWPGMRLPSGLRAGVGDFFASLAIPRSCLIPCLLSAPLFWAIHVGKPDAELWLSLPAGPIFAWLAYRTNGFVVPLLVHLSVPATAALLVLATS